MWLVVARLPRGFVLLTPTKRYFSAKADELLARSGAHAFSLDGLLTISNAGGLIPTDAAKAVQTRFAVKVEAVEQRPLFTVLGILKKLRDEKQLRTAPLPTVFELLVLDDLSQVEVATEPLPRTTPHPTLSPDEAERVQRTGRSVADELARKRRPS